MDILFYMCCIYLGGLWGNDGSNGGERNISFDVNILANPALVAAPPAGTTVPQVAPQIVYAQQPGQYAQTGQPQQPVYVPGQPQEAPPVYTPQVVKQM